MGLVEAWRAVLAQKTAINAALVAVAEAASKAEANILLKAWQLRNDGSGHWGYVQRLLDKSHYQDALLLTEWVGTDDFYKAVKEWGLTPQET